MFESFAKVKNEAMKITKEIKTNENIDKDVLKNSKLEQELFNLANGEFKIALIAPFSAGKSTFINSLIGQDLLSMEVTAETSVITRIKFSKDIKIEIIYRDGNKIETIPAKGEGALTVDDAKEILEQKTTVKGENTEDNIKEVKVYYPIEMCKDNVEFVDTPGLFARYEKHSAITTNVLPTVNAVVFMIDPESVGQQHFTQVIQNYVKNAKNSSMETGGRHIFFVINKIDNFSLEDRAKAKKELTAVLKGIIDEPQIYEISAYYAMIGKMYLSKTIELIQIQKDIKIKFIDPKDPEFPVSGRQITDENAYVISQESKIKDLEDGLEKYLQAKNGYLISNVNNEINSVISQSIEKKKIELEELKTRADIDKDQYTKKMKDLQDDIKKLDNRSKYELHKKINNRLTGGSGGKSISEYIDDELKSALKHIGNNIVRKINNDWFDEKISLTKENANDKITKIIDGVQNELEIQSKEMLKETFTDFKDKIGNLMYEIDDEFKKIKEEFKEAEIRNIGKSFSNLGNYNIEGIISSITKGIENEFSDMVGNISNKIMHNAEEAKDDCTVITEKSGFFYGIWSFFTGDKEYVTKFDIYEFKKELDKAMYEVQNDIKGAIDEMEGGLSMEMENSIEVIGEKLRQEVTTAIRNITNLKQSMINNVLKSMKDDESIVKQTISKLEKTIKNLENIKQKAVKLEEEMGAEF